MTTGVVVFMIPAFSVAISGNVFPRRAIWSIPILVIILNIGLIILVLSNLPPNPVSIMAISTFSLAKYSKAIPTVISKKLGATFSINGFILFVKLVTNVSEHMIPFTLMRSLKSYKCGDVYNPVLYPASCNIDANI